MIQTSQSKPTWFSQRALPSIWRCIYIASFCHLKIRRVSRRYNHPYLYTTGVVLNTITGNNSLFLSSLAKIMRIARILHESLELGQTLTHSFSQCIQLITKPIYSCSKGYLSRVENRSFPIEKKDSTALSFRYTSPLISLFLRRCELIISKVKEILTILFKISFSLFELWQTLCENPSDMADDLFIELNEICRKYESESVESLFSQLEKHQMNIQIAFESFHISIDLAGLIAKARIAFASIFQVKNRLETLHNVCNEAIENTGKVLLGTI